jgi:hypothetical protein
MGRFFNTAGPCIAEDHYMLPAAARCAELLGLIERRQFFVIHAARQTGKTTLLNALEQDLNAGGRYHALYCSLETVQEFGEAERGIPAIVAAIRSACRYHPVLGEKGFAVGEDAAAISTVVKDGFTALARSLDRPLVVLFDEADCLSNGTLIAFLRQLRDGYVNRVRVPFIHSLALVGMRNLRDYKARIRDGRETLGSASPFNVVSDALTLRNFSRDEIATLYAQHTADTGQAFPPAVVDRVHYYTDGQPWLVNAIAREVVDRMLGRDHSRAIEPGMVDLAADTLMRRRDTHIDSLLERLKEERIKRVVEPLLQGDEGEIQRQSDDFQYALDLGLVRSDKGVVRPANRIYGEVIARTLNYDAQEDLPPELIGRWIGPEGLRLTGLLREFQQFWRENSAIWTERFWYREAAPHLILQAYLQRVANGGALIEREFATGTRRVDLCLTWAGRRYPIELKLYAGDKTVAEGCRQLAAYMDTLGCQEGWLIVFDRRPEVPWDEKLYWRTESVGGKALHLVGC